MKYKVTEMTKLDLKASECDDYFLRYINKLSNKTELRKGFEIGKDVLIDFFKSIPKDKLENGYESGKWTVKEILQHLIDTERIFIYRCFRIARQDKTALAGYDQDLFIKPSKANDKSIDHLLNEFTANRNHSISLLDSLSDEDLTFIGTSSGGAMSARAAAFIIIGHDIWHMEVIQNKYL